MHLRSSIKNGTETVKPPPKLDTFREILYALFLCITLNMAVLGFSFEDPIKQVFIELSDSQARETFRGDSDS